MNRTARVLAFPVSVAAVMAAEGCQGLSMTDPMVRGCRVDTTEILVQFPNGRTARDTMIVDYTNGNCRQAA